jgi:hypothetical protein
MPGKSCCVVKAVHITLLQLNDGRSGCNDNHHLRSPPCVAVQLLQVCYAYTCVYVHMPPMATDLNFPCVAGWLAHELGWLPQTCRFIVNNVCERSRVFTGAARGDSDTLSMRMSCPQRMLLNGHPATALHFCSLLVLVRYRPRPPPHTQDITPHPRITISC